MSYSLDANLLLYASDRSNPDFAAASRFLEARIDDPDLFLIAWMTLMAYVRIATHPRIFNHPLSPQEALDNVDGLLALPRLRTIGEEPGFLTTYRASTEDQAARGNHVPDAHLATVLRQHGVRTLYTADRDFRRFDFLDVRNPL